MQQEASRKLNFQSSRVMRVAQELYEGVNIGAELGGTQGLITYMRTDSLRVSAEAQTAAAELIRGRYGERYCPETPRVYKARAGAQDAHEAIRPARVEIEPAMVRKSLTPDQYRLYKLIWERFVASQMESAELETLTVDLECSGWVFRASGYTVTFPGYMAVYEEAADDGQRNRRADDPEEQRDLRIPPLREGERLPCTAVEPGRHFTEPPPRYTEGSFIKLLEEKGIGRPSTFATIVSTITTRGYVKREGKALVPTQLGEVTNDIMLRNFATIVDEHFTARMENDLDGIEEGKESMEDVLSRFWNGFEKQLEQAEKQIGSVSVSLPVEETDFVCDKCGSRMIVKNGRFGKFAACPNYPSADRPGQESRRGGTDRYEVRAVRRGYGPAFRTLWILLCLLAVSGMQIHKAEDQGDRRSVPQVRRTDRDEERTQPRGILLLRKLPEVRFFLVGYAHQGEMPAVRRDAVPQEGEAAAGLPCGGMRLLAPV